MEPINQRADDDVPRKGSEKPDTQSGFQPTEGTRGSRVPISDADLAGYSELARRAVNVARVRSAANGSIFSTTRSLLVAFLAIGKGNPRDRSTPAWLWAHVREQRRALEEAANTFYPEIGLSLNLRPGSGSSVTHQITPDFAGVLSDARRLGRDASGEPRVAARHLLGSLLAPRGGEPTNAEKLLLASGVNLPRLRRAFVAALEQWRLGDDLPAWRALLLGSTASLDQLLSGYTSDDVAGDDLIGITHEVEAMASLAAAWSVEPPLSIGLFGEWGSGKSFFMQKMKERVRAIAAAARESAVSQKQFGYYKNIVQVEFNAWHYVEGNLWAGLVEHIFQNLRVLETDADEEIAERQRKLFAELRAVQTSQSEAEEATKKLASEKEQIEIKQRKLEQEQRDAEQRAAQARQEVVRKAEQKRAVTARDVIQEVYASDEVRGRVAELLNLSEESLATPAAVRAAVAEGAEGWSALRDAWGVVTADRGAWKILLLALAVPAAVALIGWLASLGGGSSLGSLVGSLGTAVSTVLGLAASAVAAWKRFAPQLKPVFDAAREVRATRDRLEARVEEAKRQRDDHVVALEGEAEQKRQEAADAEVEAKTKGLEAQKAAEDAEAAGRKIEDIRKQIDDLRPERMIASFIQDRAAADDYRKHLGVPALIRRDFEKLSGLFRSQRKEEMAERDGLDKEGMPLGGEQKGEKTLPARNDPTVVNRIILYVDDLDRCPPDKVVQVMRAIHLLLAFPLFVVVVAVDARWVRRALKDQFELMLSADEERANEGESGASTSPADHRATTDDYLEKIFQVPFWLRPLGDEGSKNLLLNLIPPSAEDRDEVDEETHVEERPPEGETNEQAEEAPAAQAAQGTKPAWTAIKASPKTLAITRQEHDYMVELSSIVGRSPRAVKRFLNCYRLIKAMLEPEVLEVFAPETATPEGEFHATMLLLATVSGAPPLATTILHSLSNTTAKTSAAWLKDLSAKGALLEDWQRLELLLKPLVDKVPLASWQEAASRVDRFAFTPIRTRA